MGGEVVTFHFEVLVAFASAETEFFCVVADKHNPVAWIYGPGTVAWEKGTIVSMVQFLSRRIITIIIIIIK